MQKSISLAAFAVLAVALVGCGQDEQEKPVSEAAKPAVAENPSQVRATPSQEPPGASASQITTEEELKAALKEKNPDFQGEVVVDANNGGIYAVEIHDPAVEDIGPLAGLPLRVLDLARCHVADISPLKGAPLMELYLEETGVEDISTLKGMPLVKLYLSNTKVSDIGPLKGARLKELNLVGTKVADLSPLEGMGLEMLWLTGCPVSDIGPLQSVRLVSVTLADTKVSDISPLKGHPTLQRLHIAGTEVTDLSPLQWMKLTRLIFTPNRIKKGIEHARQLQGLGEIGTEFEGRMPPAQFWPLYDAGKFN